MASSAQKDEEFHVSTFFSYYKAPYFKELVVALLIGLFSSTLFSNSIFRGAIFRDCAVNLDQFHYDVSHSINNL
jgi:hypothetical protein